MDGAAWAFAAAGWATGLALFVPLYALGGMGAGDVKLLGAIGAWLGPMGAVWTGLYGAIAGGVLALAVAVWQRLHKDGAQEREERCSACGAWQAFSRSGD